MDLSNEDPSEETSLKPQPFLAFSKPGSFLDSPSTTSQPQPSPQPRRRQPKQQQDDEEEEASEPKAEPEAGHHGKGNPRTHAFHSCKITKNLPSILLVSHQIRNRFSCWAQQSASVTPRNEPSEARSPHDPPPPQGSTRR